MVPLRLDLIILSSLGVLCQTNAGSRRSVHIFQIGRHAISTPCLIHGHPACYSTKKISPWYLGLGRDHSTSGLEFIGGHEPRSQSGIEPRMDVSSRSGSRADVSWSSESRVEILGQGHRCTCRTRVRALLLHDSSVALTKLT